MQTLPETQEKYIRYIEAVKSLLANKKVYIADVQNVSRRMNVSKTLHYWLIRSGYIHKDNDRMCTWIGDKDIPLITIYYDIITRQRESARESKRKHDAKKRKEKQLANLQARRDRDKAIKNSAEHTMDASKYLTNYPNSNVQLKFELQNIPTIEDHLSQIPLENIIKYLHSIGLTVLRNK